MPSSETLALFTAAAVLLNILPGPSNLYVMSLSIARGAGAGMLSAAGLATGNLFHVTAAALGLSAIFAYSPLAFAIAKWLGAAYLAYLGLRLLREKSGTVDTPLAMSRLGLRRIYGESVLVELLNPKTALFFLAFLPQFVEPARGSPFTQIVILGLIVTATAIPCDVLVAVAANHMARRLRRSPGVQRLQRWLSGSILIGLGLFLVSARRD